jgi:hypothetical protein
VTSAEMDELVRRANRAGFKSIADYAVSLERRVQAAEQSIRRAATNPFDVSLIADEYFDWRKRAA